MHTHTCAHAQKIQLHYTYSICIVMIRIRCYLIYCIACFFEGESFDKFHESIAIHENLPSKYIATL